MWDPPRPGREPVFPALAGRLSTTAPPGKPPWCIFCVIALFHLANHKTYLLSLSSLARDLLSLFTEGQKTSTINPLTSPVHLLLQSHLHLAQSVEYLNKKGCCPKIPPRPQLPQDLLCQFSLISSIPPNLVVFLHGSNSQSLSHLFGCQAASDPHFLLPGLLTSPSNCSLFLLGILHLFTK